MIERPAPPSLAIEVLGPPQRSSPLEVPSPEAWVDDRERILLDPHLEPVRASFSRGAEPPSFEVAGPRSHIYFDPAAIRVAIATCGGLSPGLNDVVRALVLELRQRYGVRRIVGIHHGYQGLGRGPARRPLELTPAVVDTIHERGGSLLGTSRGTPPTGEIVDALERLEVDVFFPIGGDGTVRGALAIHREAARRGLGLAVVVLPKTIDNDLPYVRRSFGFETAVTVASRAVRAAALEAESIRRGVGMVKLMGRSSGYLAASACLASGDADFCLVPEVPFGLAGEEGLLALLERRLARRGNAVIVVAEGAGQEYFARQELGTDASGNARLADVGPFLRRAIAEHFAALDRPVAVKYIDPSYLVRSAPANASDSLHCARLGQNAVHAAMAGKAGLLIGYWHGRMTHVPLAAAAGAPRRLNPAGELWWNVLESTGQPARIGAPPSAATDAR